MHPVEEILHGSMDEPLMTSIGAAEYLGISRRKLDSLKKDRKITYLKVGKLIRYRKSDLNAFAVSSVASE